MAHAPSNAQPAGTASSTPAAVGGIFGQLPSQHVGNIMAQQRLLQQHREIEYFYVYVAESEFSNVGYWILLEPDKTLSLQILRGYFSTCFGIKYKVGDANKVDTRYIRYHNGFFQFPTGLDMNNTRFVAYYYNDVEDVTAFMQMAEANDDGVGTVPALEFKSKDVPECNDSTIFGRTASNFEMENVLMCGAQSTPKMASKLMPSVENITKSLVQINPSKGLASLENVSSTSDCILNEPTVEVISVHDSQSFISQRPPPPPPGPPQSPMPALAVPVVQEVVPVPAVAVLPTTSAPISIKAKLGPSVSSSSDVDKEKRVKTDRAKHERITTVTVNDSSGFQREHNSVMVRVEAAPKNKNMLNRYQTTRGTKQLDVNDKTPLKITLKTRGRQTQRDTKILKIEDEKGRTTAILTKKKWAGKPTKVENQKRRSDPEDSEFGAERYDKRPKFDKQQKQHYQHPVETKPATVYDDYYRTLNVLLVGFHTTAPVIHETTKYFAEFGVVTNLQLFTQENRQNAPEYYAYMMIRTDDAVSLFSDRHLYNGTVIYAIRVDGTRLPPRLSCKVCGYQGLNVGYLHYHLEGHYHQQLLQKRLESLAVTVGNVYRDSYYRITHDELYVQYPNDAIQELVRNDYWKRSRNPSSHTTAMNVPSNRFYSTDRERYY